MLEPLKLIVLSWITVVEVVVFLLLLYLVLAAVLFVASALSLKKKKRRVVKIMLSEQEVGFAILDYLRKAMPSLAGVDGITALDIDHQEIDGFDFVLVDVLESEEEPGR